MDLFPKCLIVTVFVISAFLKNMFGSTSYSHSIHTTLKIPVIISGILQTTILIRLYTSAICAWLDVRYRHAAPYDIALSSNH